MANGYDGLRLTEYTFGLKNEDWNAFTNYEKKVNRLIENYQIMALCTYSFGNYNAVGIIDVIAHPLMASLLAGIKVQSKFMVIHGIAFQVDENFVPVFLHGAVE